MRYSLYLVAACFTVTAHAQAPARYGVGFRLVREIDHSRTTGPVRDFEGRANGTTAWPMMIGVWYPTAASSSAPRVTLGDYLVLSKLRDGDRPVTEADRIAGHNDMKSFAQFALRREITDSAAAAAYGQRMNAVRNAAPASGRFPVVIAGTDGSLSSGVQLFETLTRRGFVVIATPSRPTMGALQVTKPNLVIDSRIRDLEYLTAHARQYPFVDPERLAVVGINFDGMAALLYEMKNMRAFAVASIDGWEGKRNSTATVRASSLYDPLRMRVPYFVAQQDEPDAPPGLAHDFTIFNAIRYGSGEHVVVSGLSHAYLIALAALYPGTPDDLRLRHQALMDRIAAFLDAAARRTDMSLATTDSASFKDHRRRAALPAVPMAEELERILTAPGGPERLRTIFREARSQNPNVELFTQGTLNLFAFRLSRTQRVPESLLLMELGTEAFPQSAVARNDYGNSLLQAADTAGAVREFERALTLLDGDPSMSADDRTQSRTVIQGKIDRLRSRRPF